MNKLIGEFGEDGVGGVARPGGNEQQVTGLKETATSGIVDKYDLVQWTA